MTIETDTDRALGFGVPEYVICQLIGHSLQNIREHIDDAGGSLIDQLFARLSAPVRDSLKDWIRAHKNLNIQVNYPKDDIALPFIVVVTESEDESPDLAMLGDMAGMATLGEGGSRERRIVGLQYTTHVIVGTEDANLTLYLGALLRYILLSNKDALTRLHDIHALRTTSSDLQYDERFSPSFCYLRQVTLSYATFFDFNLTERSALLTSLELMVSTTESGLVVTTAVPTGEE